MTPTGFIHLLQIEPSLTATSANPAYSVYQQTLISLEKTLSTATTDLKNRTVEDGVAQKDYETERSKQIPPLIRNGPGQPAENPEYEIWNERVIELNRLRVISSDALASALTAKSNAQAARDKAIAEAPAPSLETINPAHVTWESQVDQARAGFRAMTRATLFANSAALDAASLANLQAGLAQQNSSLRLAQYQLGQAQAALPLAQAQAVSLAQRMAAAQPVLDQARTALAAADEAHYQWIGKSPPRTVPVPNPAYPAWQSRVAAENASVATATTLETEKRTSRDAAQKAYDDAARDPPDRLLENGHPNLDYAPWAARVAALKTTLDTAQTALAAATANRVGAQMARDIDVASAPQQTVQVNNPAYDTWSAESGRLAQVSDDLRGPFNTAQASVDAVQSSVTTNDLLLRIETSKVNELPGEISQTEARIATIAQSIAIAQATPADTLRWTAVLGTGPFDDAAAADLVVELQRQLIEVEPIVDDLRAQASDTDDATWRLNNRVAELNRAISACDERLAELHNKENDYQTCFNAVIAWEATTPTASGGL